MSSAAIILATDSGEGFAQPKYLTPIRGKRLLQHAIDDAVSWPVDEILVVVGSDAEPVIDVIDFEGTTVIVDTEWEEGSASAYRAALDLLSRNGAMERCVIARGDQPGVDPSIVSALIETAVTSDADAVVPKYRYSRGWPVVIDRSMWEHLLGSEGSVDIHDVIASHAASVEDVWVDHLAPRVIATSDDIRGKRQ